jgi:hypothetical protein
MTEQLVADELSSNTSVAQASSPASSSSARLTSTEGLPTLRFASYSTALRALALSSSQDNVAVEASVYEDARWEFETILPLNGARVTTFRESEVPSPRAKTVFARPEVASELVSSKSVEPASLIIASRDETDQLNQLFNVGVLQAIRDNEILATTHERAVALHRGARSHDFSLGILFESHDIAVSVASEALTRINSTMQQSKPVRSIFNQLSISDFLVSTDLFESLNPLYSGDVLGVIADGRVHTLHGLITRTIEQVVHDRNILIELSIEQLAEKRKVSTEQVIDVRKISMR